MKLFRVLGTLSVVFAVHAHARDCQVVAVVPGASVDGHSSNKGLAVVEIKRGDSQETMFVYDGQDRTFKIDVAVSGPLSSASCESEDAGGHVDERPSKLKISVGKADGHANESARYANILTKEIDNERGDFTTGAFEAGPVQIVHQCGVYVAHCVGKNEAGSDRKPASKHRK